MLIAQLLVQQIKIYFCSRHRAGGIIVASPSCTESLYAAFRNHIKKVANFFKIWQP